MPNWTRNYVCISGPEEQVTKLHKHLGCDRGLFDFEAIIPMPAIIKDISRGAVTIDGETIHNWVTENGVSRKLTPEEQATVDEHGDWYDWSIENWGVKWPASDIVTTDVTESRWASDLYGFTAEFNTPWDAPRPIIEALEEQYPDLSIEWMADHEDGGPERIRDSSFSNYFFVSVGENEFGWQP